MLVPVHGQLSLERSPSLSVWKQSLHEKLHEIQQPVIHFHSESVKELFWWWSGMHLFKRHAVHPFNIVVFAPSDDEWTVVLDMTVLSNRVEKHAGHFGNSSVSRLCVMASVVPASQEHRWMTVIHWPESEALNGLKRSTLLPHCGTLNECSSLPTSNKWPWWHLFTVPDMCFQYLCDSCHWTSYTGNRYLYVMRTENERELD